MGAQEKREIGWWYIAKYGYVAAGGRDNNKYGLIKFN
jgi:hypothetical protein